MVLPVLTHNGAYDDDYDLCVIKWIHLNSILNHFHVCILKYKQVICQKRKALSRDLSTSVLKKQEIKNKNMFVLFTFTLLMKATAEKSWRNWKTMSTSVDEDYLSDNSIKNILMTDLQSITEHAKNTSNRVLFPKWSL